MLTTRCNTVQN